MKKREVIKIIALTLAGSMTMSTVGCSLSSTKTESTISDNAVSIEVSSNDSTVQDSTEEVSSESKTEDVDAIVDTSDEETQENVVVATDSIEVQDQDADENLDEEFGSEVSATEGSTIEITDIAEESIETENTSVETNSVKSEDIYNDDSDELTATQRNCINMLNYMTVLAQRVNKSAKNQAFLEAAYSSLENDLYPNAVDNKTQAQSTSLLDTINNYRMISVKWNRIEYIYEQNRAQALRQAIPNPMGLLSAVQSGSMLKAAASVIYMALDSKTSYDVATSQADSQFLKDGWELEDAESDELHNSTKSALNYMYNMVRDYDIPGDYALNRESVESFVTWAAKSNLVSKIAWLETNQKTYQKFGPYWLELAKDYYDSEEYEKCLEAIRQYESISTRIFRKDIDYAKTLPMVIISARETLDSDAYIEMADRYCSLILANTKDEDWSTRYFAAQIYLDLYERTKDEIYEKAAYKIAFDNVNILADEQRTLNKSYLADVIEAKADKGATKREKEEVKEYNKSLKNERKIALPPVSEALYLNCDLLFALAEDLKIPAKEQKRIESIIHENGEAIFLTEAMDSMFWFGNEAITDSDDVETEFDGDIFTIPASCISDRSKVSVSVGSKSFDDWTVEEVMRPKKSRSVSEFSVTFNSQTVKDYKFKAGDKVVITVIPVVESPEKTMTFTYNVVAVKKAFVINGIDFERIK